VEQSISVTGSRSSGFEYDRDFRNVSVSARTSIGSHSSFFISHVNKEFGANNFYGPAPSREWTNQTMVSAEQRHEWKSVGKALFQEYYRTHGDRFLYDTRSPGLFESSHRTQSAGILAKVQSPLTDVGEITVGAELGGDWISSNNLGNHRYARTSLFTEVEWAVGKAATVYPGVRFDYYSNFGSAVNPSLSGSWWIARRIRLRSSVGRAFRIPTFTELYYHDPNNQATSSLKPESAWSAELGMDFIPAKNWLGSLTLFSRRERNVIDWIRATPTEKWHTANIRDLHTDGVEVDLEHQIGSKAGIAAHYRRLKVDPGAIDYISKYVLDFARDSWSASIFFPMPLAFAYRQTLNYKMRSNGRDYWLLDGRLERPFGRFNAGIDFTNLLNSQYQEVAGVDMPGRWVILTLRTR
jgi:outer membrane receptor protein involved in Fe transport